MVTLPLKLNNMKITHEIREYIVEDNNIKYSVRHNILSDDWFYYIIEEPAEGTHVNSVSWFDASDELKDKIRYSIKLYTSN